MSTQTPPAPPKTQAPNSVTIYSHSSLFYWWPVWAVGFILGLLTLTENKFMVVVPGDAEIKRHWTVQIEPTKTKTEGGVQIVEQSAKVEDREGVLLKHADDPKKQKHLSPNKDEADLGKDPILKLHTTSKRGYGVLFATVLLLVVFITNVPLRGMWSVMIIMLIILLSIIFALAGWWDRILSALSLLDIRLNTGGYFFISTALLLLWLFTFLLFDRQLYIVFQPRSFKVCLEIGSGEKQFDATGMVIEKERSDMFRHWILGLGSGDMVVKTTGAERHEFRLNNVLFIGRKLRLVEEMQSTVRTTATG